MKLLFDEITSAVRHFTIADGPWLKGEECSLSATFTVCRRDPETVHLAGRLDGCCHWPCDRCGEQTSGRLHGEFVYLVTTRKEAAAAPENECRDEDAITLYLSEPIIDVGAILQEQALLAIPWKILCRADCKGICAGCGVVLNDDRCRCPPDSSHSPFSVLKKLTGNENNS